MRPECEDAIEQALGRPLRRGESKQIDKLINYHMRNPEDPEAWAKMGHFDRVQVAAAAAGKAMVAAVKQEQYRVQLQIQAHARIENTLENAYENLPDKFKVAGARQKLVDALLAPDKSVHGRGIRSVWSSAEAIRGESIGPLMDVWSGIKGFLGLFENKAYAKDLTREFAGEDSGNPTAKAAAPGWFKLTDELNERANAAGMSIGKLDNHDWRQPQIWDGDRISSAGKDAADSAQKYVDSMLPLLKRERYMNEDGTKMSDDEVGQHVLLSAYDTATTDGHNKMSPGSHSDGRDPAGDMSKHRVLHFKDADSYMKAQAMYGRKSIYEGMLAHVDYMAREIALREQLGPDHKATFDHFAHKAFLDDTRQFGNPTAAKARKAFSEGLYDYVSGKHKVSNQKVSDWWQAGRNLITVASLHNVALTALTDEAGMFATASANKLPWFEIPKREAAFLNPKNADLRRYARHSGLGFNTALGGFNRFGSDNFLQGAGTGMGAKVKDFTSKIVAATMKYGGAEPVWDGRKQALGSQIQSAIAHLVTQHDHFSEINEHDHGVLAHKGVTEKEWQVWKAAEPEDYGIGKVLTPKSIANIPDEAIAHLGDPRTLKRYASTSLMAHILEENQMGVMEQGPRQRMVQAKFKQIPSTTGANVGELAGSMFMFKGFAWSMMANHWTRARSLENGAGYAVKLITSSAVLGAVVLTLKALARGENPPNVAEPAFAAKAILQGGGLGFYGDFVNAAVNTNGNDIIAGLMGPAVSQAQSLYNISIGAAMAAGKGERTDEKANLIKYARGLNPMNFWYTQAAFDHFLWNDMQEAANPGYLDRMQDRASQARGTSWYWDPHEKLPSAAPDFSKMWQPDKGKEQLDSMARVGRKIVGADE